MILGKKIICLIPARGGSKGIKLKNLKKIIVNNNIEREGSFIFANGDKCNGFWKNKFVSLSPSDLLTKKSNLQKILSYEVLSETEWNEDEKSFNPNYFVRLDKSDINNKVKAFLKYRSQTKKFPHPRSKEAIVNLSKVRGSQVFMKYAEAFKVEKILD